MERPVQITIGQSPRDCRVTINGVDITRHVQRISIVADSRSMPLTTLTLTPGAAQVSIDAVAEVINALQESRPEQISEPERTNVHEEASRSVSRD